MRIISENHLEQMQDILERPFTPEELIPAEKLSSLSQAQMQAARQLLARSRPLAVMYLQELVAGTQTHDAMSFLERVIDAGVAADIWEQSRSAQDRSSACRASHSPEAYLFRSPMSPVAMLSALNANSPASWRLNDSDTGGEYLSTWIAGRSRLRIFDQGNGTYLLDILHWNNEVEVFIMDVVFPTIQASDTSESNAL